MAETRNEEKTSPGKDFSDLLAHCASEEIRVPGSIQPHGFLLAFDPANDQVVVCSENAAEYLDVPNRLILGGSIQNLLDREVRAAVDSSRPMGEPSGLVSYLGAYRIKGEYFSLTTHQVNSLRMLEFEKVDQLISPELMNAVVTNFVSSLSKHATEQSLLDAVTAQVRELTGFNRVLLYSFDERGHGTVLSESNDGVLPSFLGLRFPSSDIPPQARELYLRNTVRIIPNAYYTPSPLVGQAGFDPSRSDLSLSTLRRVSPVHLEYMRNMGTGASMSVSIVIDGKLWGLISGHSHEPHAVPYIIRSACDLLTKVTATRLVTLATEQRLRDLMHLHEMQRRALTSLAAENDFAEGLLKGVGDLPSITNAEGAAVVLDGRISKTGNVPEDATLLRLVDWLEERDSDFFSSHCMGEDSGWGHEMAQVASGILAVRLSEIRHGYALWFRPEVVETVRWAGEPEKGIAETPQGLRLSPRHSFTQWQQQLHGQSVRWKDTEQDAARDFRNAVVTISLRRTEEVAEVNEARFLQLTHALPALVWTADDNGNLTYVNEGWEQMDFASSGFWLDAASISSADRERSRVKWQQAVKTGGVFEEELTTNRPGEPLISYLVRAVPLTRRDGVRAGWVGAFTDISDRLRREAALRISEKLATTGRMTSVIAHEINNPLESLVNLLYLLRTEVHSNDGEHYIRQAESELERISGITKQTLRWNRESPDVAVDASVAEMFDDVLRLFTGKLRNRNVHAHKDVPAGLQVFGVVGQIRQVVANLVANAVDAVPMGGQVELAGESVAGGVQIIVRDNGGGMSADTLRRAFEPFFTTKGDRGNGLGLYISQEIIERHHGTLTVDSKVDVGTTMTIFLPAGSAES